MAQRVTVKVVRRKHRKQYTLRWPGHESISQAKWGDEAQAYREAFELEERLNNPKRAILTWEYATRCYEEWHLVHHGSRHLSSWITAKNRFSEWCGADPPDINKIGNALLSQFAADLSKEIAMETVKGYFRYLTGFFKWCHEQQEWIDKTPKVKLPRRKQGERKSKGRPLTLEEFERLVRCIPGVVGAEYASSWEFLVKGLWESSLRLSEALKLHWEKPPVRLNLDGKYPMIDFEIMGHKGRTKKQLPCTRAFANSVEGKRRKGFVFRPYLSKGETRSLHTWSHRISDMGKAALIVVDNNEQTDKKKFASAHDLRRSFLERWRNKVDAAILQVMARHENLSTTQAYYLSDQAEQVAQAIWEADET